MTVSDHLADITRPPMRANFRLPTILARVLGLAARPFGNSRFWARRLEYPFCDWDEAVTRAIFRRVFGREIDLKNPKTFNEKISWLKLYDRRPVLTVFADKVAVRDYVRERGFGDILLELYGVWDRPEDVPVEDLPEAFALKAAHGWRMNWLRQPGEPLRADDIRREMRRWARTDHSLRRGEWQYRGVPRRILAERLLPIGGGEPREYKFFCFGGVPKFVRHIDGRFDRGDMHKANFDLDWRKLPFKRRGNIDFTGSPPRPRQLDRMIEIAAALSAGEPFLRIDLYEVEGRIIFGELTLRPDGGALPLDPPEWDARLGDWIELPARSR